MAGARGGVTLLHSCAIQVSSDQYISVLILLYICGRRGCGVTLLHSNEKASDNLDWIIGTHGARLSVGDLQLLVYEALSC